MREWWPGTTKAINELLHFIGEDPERDGLRDTPQRIIESWKELLGGYDMDPKKVLAKTFEESSDEMVVVTNIPFVSFCEHRCLPFQGVVHIGYLPDKRIIGLSKLPRLVDVFAKRLQIQERLTVQIVDAIMEHLSPKGCGAVVEAGHMCLGCRGAKKENVMMITSALRGLFKDNDTTKAEFLAFTQRNK